MAKAKKVKARINPGLRLDAVNVTDKVTVTKDWTEITQTVAKSMVGSTWKGRPLFEFDDEVVDEAPSEDPVETEDGAE